VLRGFDCAYGIGPRSVWSAAMADLIILLIVSLFFAFAALIVRAAERL
jgi:hypothetical protein